MQMESTEKTLRTPCPRENARNSSDIAVTSQISVTAMPMSAYPYANPPATTAIPRRLRPNYVPKDVAEADHRWDRWSPGECHAPQESLLL
ncbi:MAG: hypothetical protein WBF04_18555 [Candidatus Sulfotelmatobacter sp.]